MLAKAISEALARADAKYGIADRFDDTKGEYVGLKLGRLVEVDFNSEIVLVRRQVAEEQLAKRTPRPPRPAVATTRRYSRPKMTPARGLAVSMPRSCSIPTVRHRRSATSLSRS